MAMIESTNDAGEVTYQFQPGTAYEDIFGALAAPFADHEVNTRSQGGFQVPYIAGRSAQNRFDEVLGPENWWDDFIPTEHGAICKITIRLPDGTQITKCDVGGDAGMSDSGDNEKSGFSDAFKRCAVKFGVGRYLYGNGVPFYVKEAFVGANERYREATPRRPSGSTGSQPSGGQSTGSGRPSGRPTTQQPTQNANGDPTTGKGLFAWCADANKNKRYGDADLVKWAQEIGNERRYPPMMVNWTTDQVSDVFRVLLAELAQAQQA